MNHLTAMQLFYAQGDLEQAVQHAQNAIENLSPEDDELLFAVLKTAADLYDACLDSSEACELLKHPLSMGKSSNDIEFNCIAAELALSTDDEIDAARALTEALKIEPYHPRVLALQARLTARHGDVKSAELTLQNALTAWGNLPPHEILSPVGILAISEAAIELQEWSTAIFLLQRATDHFSQEPRAHLRLARGLVLRAEYQRLCETLLITQHASGSSSITDFSHQNFEQAILKAAQTSEENSSKNIQTEIAHWQLRGQAVFQPSVAHAQALAEIPQTSESRAALLAALRHSRDTQSKKLSALSSFAKTSYRLMQEQDIGLNLMIQLALALSIRNPNQAFEAVQKAQEIAIRQRHPSLPIIYAVKAYVADHASNPDEVVEALETGLSHWPGEAGWHSWLAEALQETSEPDEQKILDHLHKAVELEPKNGYHYLKLGQVQLQRKEYQSAISNLEQATQLIPNNTDSWLALANANRLIGEFSQTFQNAERAIQLEPKNINAQLLLIETALEIHNPRKALQYCQVAEKISPEHPDVLLLKARALDGLGSSDDALHTFNQALKYVPKSVPLMLEYAQVTQKAKGHQLAIQTLRDLTEEYPEDPRVLAVLAEMLIESEQSDPAVQVAQKALNTNQGDLDCDQESDLLKMLGRLMRRNGQLDHAIQYLTDAIQCNPENIESYIELGRAYQERRQYAQALDAYHQAIAISPGDHRAYYFAGQAFKATKDYGSAEDMLRRAAKLAPEDLAIRRQLGGLVALNLVHNPKEGADLYVD